MSFDNNNSGYSTPENSGFDFNAYPFGEPSTRAAQTSGFDLDTTAAGPSTTTETEDWWLEPMSDGGVGRYTGSALLDPPSGFAGPYDSQAWTNGWDASECYLGLVGRKNSVRC